MVKAKSKKSDVEVVKSALAKYLSACADLKTARKAAAAESAAEEASKSARPHGDSKRRAAEEALYACDQVARSALVEAVATFKLSGGEPTSIVDSEVMCEIARDVAERVFELKE